MIVFTRFSVLLLFFVPLFASVFFLIQNMSAMELVLSSFYTEYVVQSSYLTLLTGFLSTCIATSIVFFCGYAFFVRANRKNQWLLSLFLSVPHLAFFTGAFFMLSQSGFVSRVLSTIFGPQTIGFVGFDRDTLGITFSTVLGLKEGLFLLFVSLPKIYDSSHKNESTVSASFGHSSFTTWTFLVWPQILSSMRFPVWMVLAYSVSVVDLAVVLAPTNPPPFSIVLWEYFQGARDSNIAASSLGSFHLIALLLFLIVVWEAGLWLVRRVLKFRLNWAINWTFALPTQLILGLFFALHFFPLIILILWGISEDWPFPKVFPSNFTLEYFTSGLENLRTNLLTTVVLGVGASALATFVCLLWLEWDSLAQNKWISFFVIFVPVFPMLPMLFGLQIYFERLKIESPLVLVLCVHSFFVFPYVYFILKDYFLSFDKRLKSVSLSLGRGIFYFFYKVRIKAIFGGILTAFSVGFAVGVSQYLSTLMLGGGRVETLTTEMVVAVAGQNRRWMAVYGVLQMVLPLFFFCLTQFSKTTSGAHERV